MGEFMSNQTSCIHQPLFSYTGAIGSIARETTYNWLAERPPIQHLHRWMVTFCDARNERIDALVGTGLLRMSRELLLRRLDCSPAGVELAEPPRRCRWSLCAHCHAANAIVLWSELDAYLFPDKSPSNPNFWMVIARSKFPVKTPLALNLAVRDHLGPNGQRGTIKRLAPAAAIDALSAQSYRGRVWAEARRLMLFEHTAPRYATTMYREKFQVVNDLTRVAFREYFAKAYLYSTLMMRGRLDLAVAFAGVASTSRLLQRYGAFLAIREPEGTHRAIPSTSLPPEEPELADRGETLSLLAHAGESYD